MTTNDFDVAYAQAIVLFLLCYCIGLTVGAIAGFGWL